MKLASMSEAKDADVDRLTFDRLWTAAFQAYGGTVGDKPEAIELRRYIEQSLSQEAVRNEALTAAAKICELFAPKIVETNSASELIASTAHQIREKILALKREPNAAPPQDVEVPPGSPHWNSDRPSELSTLKTPAPAAPDVTEMVKRLREPRQGIHESGEEEMKTWQQLWEQCQEAAALLARLVPGASDEGQ